MTESFNVALFDHDVKFLPTKAHATDACFDLKARAVARVLSDKNISLDVPLDEEGIIIEPNEILLIKNGVFLELKQGWEAQVRCRSGLSLKYGITIVNSPGTIDADYRNEVAVILQNTSNWPYRIRKYDRIAQLAIKQVPEVSFIVVEKLNESARGMNGFGSTGK